MGWGRGGGGRVWGGLPVGGGLARVSLGGGRWEKEMIRLAERQGRRTATGIDGMRMIVFV